MRVTKHYIFWGLWMVCLFLVTVKLHIYHKVTDFTAPQFMDFSVQKTPYNYVRKLKQALKSLNFLKSGSGYCKDMISAYNKTSPGMYEGFDRFLTELKGYNTLVEQTRNSSKKVERLEGYSAQLDTSLQVYWGLANLPFVNTVCETGFNAGHSSFLWLTANPRLHVYSFDIGSHNYARKMAAYLQTRFPQRLNVTWGDSTKTLPMFYSNHSDIKCDLVIIDGGHTVPVAKADFDNFYYMASDLHVVLMDDHPALKASWSKGPRAAWEGGKLRGKLYEIGGCTINILKRGISLGYYVLD